jgi:hypothetical protein
VNLRQKQSFFAMQVSFLIQKAAELGYEVTFGNTYRSPEEAKRLGFANSLHTERLAVDLNLFKNGRYITTGTGHTELGAWWKSRHPAFRWGGDFAKKDYNHYSMTPDGKRA